MLALDIVPLAPVGGLGAIVAVLMKMMLRVSNDQRRAEQVQRAAEAELRADFTIERRQLREECAEARAEDRERIGTLEARVRELEGAQSRRRAP